VEWARSVPDKDTFRRNLADAPTKELQKLIVNLVGNYQPRLFNDVRGKKPSAEDIRQGLDFADALIVAEELGRRGAEAPATYLLALKRHIDRLTPAEAARERENQKAAG
jgi:hypothetical protein